MASRMAGILGLVAFAMCLVVGVVEADNSFTTVVLRGLLAMICTVVVGYIAGLVVEKMLQENVGRGAEKEKSAPAQESVTEGR